MRCLRPRATLMCLRAQRMGSTSTTAGCRISEGAFSSALAVSPNFWIHFSPLVVRPRPACKPGVIMGWVLLTCRTLIICLLDYSIVILAQGARYRRRRSPIPEHRHVFFVF